MTGGVGVGTPYVTERERGLGVYTDRDPLCVPFVGCLDIFDDTDLDLDGQPGFEYLKFAFDVPVYLDKVWFGDVDDDDEWKIIVDGVTVASDSSDDPFYFLGSGTSDWFAVMAKDLDDSFTVAGLTAHVPLPAAGWMLLAGVGGLIAMRRRKSA